MKTLLLAATLGALSLVIVPACSSYSEGEGNASKSSPIGTANDEAASDEAASDEAASDEAASDETSNDEGSNQCPSVMAPQASDCPGGTWVEKKNAIGCVSGFDCVTCPSVMAPQASDCPGGTWVEKKNAIGCVFGFDCVK